MRVQEILKGNGTVHFTGLTGVQAAHISELVKQEIGADTHVIIVNDEQKAISMTNDMAFLGECGLLSCKGCDILQR